MWQVVITLVVSGIIVGSMLTVFIMTCLTLFDMTFHEILEAFNEIFKN